MRPLILIAVLLLAACSKPTDTVATTPKLDVKLLDKQVTILADRAAPARLEVAVQNLDGGEVWARNAVETFPMQSVFKAPLGAAVLAAVDRGELSLDEVLTISDMELSPPKSQVSLDWPSRARYSVRELLERAVRDSDNTAADVLMRRIGGPGALNAWLTAKGIGGIRIDRYERELQTDASGMPSFRPAWRTPQAFQAAMMAVPEAERRTAWLKYMEDPRDSAVASGVLNFLRMLNAGELLLPKSTALLTKLMTDTRTGDGRLKAGLPEGATLAHKTGTSNTLFGVTAVTNDVGILTLKDGRRYAVVVFLAESPADLKAREAIIADAMRIIVKAAG